MKFLVDAQLPRRLAKFLEAAGHDSLHTLDLPAMNQTPDEEIRLLAASESRVLITKDSDFVDSFLLRRLPPQLLLIATGNLPNEELIDLMSANLTFIVHLFTENDFVALDRSGLSIHA